MEPYVCIRCGEEREKPFDVHRPRNSGIRTCTGTVVRKSQVEETKEAERKRWIAAMTKIARQESSWS